MSEKQNHVEIFYNRGLREFFSQFRIMFMSLLSKELRRISHSCPTIQKFRRFMSVRGCMSVCPVEGLHLLSVCRPERTRP